MKTVLFVAYGAGHIRTILPVVKELQKTAGGRLNPIVLALTTAGAEARAAGAPAIGFQDLGPLDETARKWGEFLVGPRSENPVVPHEEAIAYMGRSYADLIDEHGINGAKKLYAEKGRAAFLPLRTALQALDDLKVDIVVATNSPRGERAFLEAAKLTGRPSLAIWSSLATHEISWIGQAGFTSKVCVDGAYAAEKMQAAGRPSAEIAITGNPQFDTLLANINSPEIAKFRAEKGWEPQDRVLLLAQQNEPKAHPFTGAIGDPTLPQHLNDMLIRSMADTPPNTKLCIRYHPNQESLVIPDHDKISISPARDRLDILLHAVDAVFSCSSTVAYQAALLGKPIIQGMFSIFSQDVPFDKIAAATRVKSAQEIPAIWTLLDQDLLPCSNLKRPDNISAAANIVSLLQNLES